MAQPKKAVMMPPIISIILDRILSLPTMMPCAVSANKRSTMVQNRVNRIEILDDGKMTEERDRADGR